jgi:hypothetical protein
MDEKKIVIRKKSGLKGDDGYRTFSVRIKESTIWKLDDIAAITNRSRNELVNVFLEFAVTNCVIEE